MGIVTLKVSLVSPNVKQPIFPTGPTVTIIGKIRILELTNNHYPLGYPG